MMAKKMEWKSTKIRHYYCQLMVGVLSIWDSVRIAVPSSPTGHTTEPEPGCKNIFYLLPLSAEKALVNRQKTHFFVIHAGW
jgi:hypothetical protein